MARNCVGLDIGSSSIKAVQVARTKRGLELMAFGMEPLMPQTIVDGTIMDQGAVAESIRNLWGRLHLRQKEVAIAIAGSSVMIKKILVPPMTPLFRFSKHLGKAPARTMEDALPLRLLDGLLIGGLVVQLILIRCRGRDQEHIHIRGGRARLAWGSGIRVTGPADDGWGAVDWTAPLVSQDARLVAMRR